MEVGPTTHYMMGGVRVDSDTQMSTHARACSLRRVRGRAQRREPARRQLALGPARVRQAGRRVRREVREASTAPARSTRHEVEAAARRRCAPFDRRAAAAEKPYQDPAGPAGHDAGPGRHRAQEDEMLRALDGSAELRASARARASVTGNREYNPGWHTALDLHNLLTVSEASRRPPSCARRAAARSSATTTRRRIGEVRQGERSSCERRPTGRCRSTARDRCRR